MPLWPFGRKKRRTSTSSSFATAPTAPATTSVAGVSDGPAQATAHHAPNDRPSMNLDRRGSVQHDLTALPARSELEASPHLRPANVTKPVHPYNLDRPSSSGRAHQQSVSPPSHSSSAFPTASAHADASRKAAPSRRPSNKRKKDQTLREEEIRQMSAPMHIPKRPAAPANDLLRRDSKKARRTLTKRHEDPRSSAVSLPLQDSFHSSMSAISEQRAWEIGAISILSPRPTVRLSGTGFHSPSSASEKRTRKMDKLPELARSSSKKDRRKVADLADELDSSELRILMERDQRRKERKAMEQHERLDRKLRKRAEKQRQDDDRERERRARETRQQRANPPTAIHPAFRHEQPEGELITPVSLRKQGKQPVLERGRSVKGGTYLRYPPRDDIPQNPFDDPENPFTTPGADYSPVQTPLDEPVLEIARAVRMSGHFSPPASPVQNVHPSPSLPEVTNAQPQRAVSLPATSFEVAPRRPSESSSRRTGAGTWASLFRRGISSTRASEDKPDRSSPSEFSFVNTSRESMSKQPLPAHLVQQPPVRQSGAPHRTMSKFREDLPELPISPPASRVQSPELPLVTANAAAVRRAKRAAHKQSEAALSGGSPAVAIRGRTESPALAEDQESMALSQSYGSVDSEGSWMSGRPMKRGSQPSQTRSSLGSSAKPKEDFTASFDHLPVPEHEYFSTLTPGEGSRRGSGEQTVDVTPTADLTPNDMITPDDITPLRQATARRRPTVVHNDPRFKSREGLLAEYNELATPSREGSISGDSTENSPIELQKAQSIDFGRSLGHVKSLSAGSAKLLDIQSSRHSRNVSSNPSPGASPQIFQE